MALYHILILALIQGITEFLPVSSSGHLTLYHGLIDTGVNDLALNRTIDIAVHVGTLFAVLLYFRADVIKMMCALLSIFRPSSQNKDGLRLIGLVLAGSLPVIAAGFALHLWSPNWLQAIEVVAWTTLIFGVALLWADKKSPETRTVETMSFKDAALIGLSQMLALIPGTSRSGITMTSARMLGFSRREAAHYSLLLAMVAISGAGLLGGLDVIKSGDMVLASDVLLAAGLSFISGYAAIALMMKWLERAGFAPFAYYRMALGGVLLALIYTGILA